MRTILISLMLVMFTRVVYGDAVIFSGNDVKALKQNLDLFGTSKLMGTATDPSSGGGLAAPLSSIAMNYVTGIGYIKTSAPNTGWSRIVDTAYAPGVYFAQGGNAFGAAGVLGTTDANRLDFITGGVVGMSMATGGAVTVTSASSGSLVVGPNGATNPTLQLDSSTASAVTGIKVTSAAAAGGAKIEATSSAGSEDLVLGAKGAGGTVKLQVNLLNRYIASLQGHTFSSGTGSSASSPRFSFTGSADTDLTASTEAPSTYFNLGQTRQHATGTMSLQRDFRITPSTHSFVGASALTNMHGFTVDGAPIAGTNATVTNASAIYSPGNAVGSGVTNSYGLNINANTGATNNYSAIFNGGNVGIGTSNPSDKLQVSSGEIMVSSNSSTSSAVHNGIKFSTDNLTYYSAVKANRDTLSTRIGLSFLTANGAVPVETMRINYAGYVGIGMAAPSYPLDVQGTIEAKGTNSILLDPSSGLLYTATGLVNSATGNNARMQVLAAGPFIERNIADANPALLISNTSATSTGDIAQFKSNGTVKAVVSYAGNVGIGTTTPGALLQVTKTDTSVYTPTSGASAVPVGISQVIDNLDSTNGTAALIQFSTKSGATVNRAYMGLVSSSSSGGEFVFGQRTGVTSYAERLRIDSTGRLGLGISAPTSKLHQDSGTATASYHQFTANATTGQTVTDGTLIGIDASGNAIFNNQEAAYINFLSSNTQRARITALGSLVVGNNSSALATTATDGFLYVSSSSGAPTGVPTTQTGSVPVHVDATNNAMYMYTNSAWRSVAGSTVQGSRQTGTSMSVGTAITPALGSKTVAFVVGNGGAITITASPPITTTGMIVGQELRVCGTSNTNTVTYNNSVNLVLTGSATLGKDQCLDLMFSGTDGTNLSWIETGRSF